MRDELLSSREGSAVLLSFPAGTMGVSCTGCVLESSLPSSSLSDIPSGTGIFLIKDDVISWKIGFVKEAIATKWLETKF